MNTLSLNRVIVTTFVSGALATLPTLADAAPGDEGEDASTGEGADEEAPAEGPAEASGSLSLSSDGDSKAEDKAGKGGLSKRKDKPWIKRWGPEKGMAEIGVYGGIFAPSPRLELFDPDQSLPDQGHKSFKSPALDVGLRAGYYPIKYLGVEAEGGLIPMSAEDGSGNATGWTVRGQLIGHFGAWSVTPFGTLGVGAIGVASDAGVVGNDVDPALHWGGGLKFFFNRYVQARLDVRDVVTNRQGVDDVFVGHNLEVLLGLSVTLGREKDRDTREEPKDSDGDGFFDHEDSCVMQPGVAPDGCPIGDRDGDGFLDPDDTCPDEAGVDPDGCPIKDTDGDGIMDPDDQCVEEPETANDYQDEDGCPDEVPAAVKNFSGVIEGIFFDTNKDTVKDASKKVLNKAVDVLKEYPDVKLKIIGHTDSRGDADHNKDLSRRRAESVKKFLTDKGIDASRLETEGLGPDQPRDTNDTKQGRANNRRIEFKLLTKTRALATEQGSATGPIKD